MPIIAESGPLIFSPESATPTPTPVTPSPAVTPTPAVPSDFVAAHKRFIDSVNRFNCFKREDMPQFNDADFKTHIEIAGIDKYIVESKDQYCTMQGVQDLAKKLKRFRED